MPGIFISYRRADSGPWAGRLYDHLVESLGKPQVFMDVEGGIPRGAEFGRLLEGALGACEVLLALIGPEWVRCKRSDGQRRLDVEDDWVRHEIRTALDRGIPIVPVLLGRAQLPEDADLPEDIRGLRKHQAAEVTDTRWDYDVGQLVEDLVRVAPRLRILTKPAIGPTPLVVERIRDATAQRDDLLAAIDVLNARLPNDEVYDAGELFSLIRHHLSGNFGPSRPASAWRCYCLVAKIGGEVVGTLLAYDDLAANFCFVSYLAAGTRGRGKQRHADVSRPLLEGLMSARQEDGAAHQPPRVVTEFDHPARANTDRERDKRIARIKLFELGAQTTGLELRCLDLDYVQPMLDPTKTEKHLLLAYASERLPPHLPRAEATEIVTWVYSRLYSEDIFEDPDDRERYGRHTRELLGTMLRRLPEEVRLLRARHFAAELGCGTPTSEKKPVEEEDTPLRTGGNAPDES